MCLTLDLCLREKKFIIFLYIITQLFQMKGIDVKIFLKTLESTIPLEAKIFVWMADTRSDPGYFNVDVEHTIGENEDESSEYEFADEYDDTEDEKEDHVKLTW